MGTIKRLTEGKDRQDPSSFSPDGKRVAFVEASIDIWTLPLEDSGADHPKPGKPELFLRGQSLTLTPEFSPDGRWIAYMSSEPGRFDLYVRPFTTVSPSPGDKWLVSTVSPGAPYWARNGRELFYLSTSPERRLMVANYTVKGGVFVADKPRVWTERQLPAFSGNNRQFDLAPDGKRVLVIAPPPETEAQKPGTHVTFLFNFFDYLRQRVPVSRK